MVMMSVTPIGSKLLRVRHALGTKDFPASFLRDNCKRMQVIGSQKGFRRAKSLIEASIKQATLSKDRKRLILYWDSTANDSHISHWSIFPETFFENIFYEERSCLPGIYKTCKKVNEVPYNQLEDVHGFFQACKYIYQDGLVVIKNCPTESGTVVNIAKKFGSLSHGDLYGAMFDVKVQQNPVNVAYSQRALEFHQDLVYYESPPGLQFLHAITFDQAILGGETLFLDAIAAAEEFSKSHPMDFKALLNHPVCFQKIRSGVHLKYHRPHIEVDSKGNTIAVFWAPPFEGNVNFKSANSYREYLKAYAAFQDSLNSEKYLKYFGYVLRLQEQDLIIFNNRRMLHARKAFDTGFGGNMTRHFQGCYVSIDDYVQTVEKTRQAVGERLFPVKQGYLCYN